MRWRYKTLEKVGRSSGKGPKPAVPGKPDQRPATPPHNLRPDRRIRRRRICLLPGLAMTLSQSYHPSVWRASPGSPLTSGSVPLKQRANPRNVKLLAHAGAGCKNHPQGRRAATCRSYPAIPGSADQCARTHVRGYGLLGSWTPPRVRQWSGMGCRATAPSWTRQGREARESPQRVLKTLARKRFSPVQGFWMVRFSRCSCVPRGN